MHDKQTAISCCSWFNEIVDEGGREKRINDKILFFSQFKQQFDYFSFVTGNWKFRFFIDVIWYYFVEVFVVVVFPTSAVLQFISVCYVSSHFGPEGITDTRAILIIIYFAISACPETLDNGHRAKTCHCFVVIKPELRGE